MQGPGVTVQQQERARLSAKAQPLSYSTAGISVSQAALSQNLHPTVICALGNYCKVTGLSSR